MWFELSPGTVLAIYASASILLIISITVALSKLYYRNK